MRNFSFSKTFFFLAVGGILATSCDTNEEIIPVDPTAEYDVVLEVSEGGGNPEKNVTVNANTQSTISAKVVFTSTSTDMKRLYITQNISGQGDNPYSPTESVDSKGDGAIDISASSGKGFTFEFDLPVPSGVSNGTVVYTFWATSGKGDFRDSSKRLVAGIGTIVLKYGTASNPEAQVRSYTSVKLGAPLGDGSSSTFISLLDGQIYKINQGEEFVSYWDFGYFYGATNNASLASTFNYPSDVIDIKTVANTTEELNHAYFSLSSLTSSDFNNISVASDLDFITQSANERVTKLVAGNVVQFVDAYGKKGLIRVNEVKGTYNSGDYISIDIKVQP